MTPPSSPQFGQNLSGTWTVWALVMGIVALKVFAARATGSVGALTALTDSIMDLLALGLVAGAGRTLRTAAADARIRRLKGSMVMAAGAFMALVCLARIIQPVPLSGGYWGPGAALAVIGLTLGLAWLRGRAVASRPSEVRGEVRDQSIAELAAAGVLALGLVAGVLLGAPALDAAAGLILAIGMVWGGWALIRTAEDTARSGAPTLVPGTPPARRGSWG
ncbi:MAG: cation transporter [Alphaproteobacteria bacterium]|nr:cation transporter [Alphaproteobacteria bacterium]